MGVWTRLASQFLPVSFPSLSILGTLGQFWKQLTFLQNEDTSRTISQDWVPSWALGMLPGMWTSPPWMGRGWYALVSLVTRSVSGTSIPFLHFLSPLPPQGISSVESLYFNTTLFKSLHMPDLHNFLWFSCMFLEQCVRQLTQGCSEWVWLESWRLRHGTSCSLLSPSL